jgi:hypothetical protein
MKTNTVTGNAAGPFYVVNIEIKKNTEPFRGQSSFEKLLVPQIDKNLPAFCAVHMFITVLTKCVCLHPELFQFSKTTLCTCLSVGQVQTSSKLTTVWLPQHCIIKTPRVPSLRHVRHSYGRISSRRCIDAALIQRSGGGAVLLTGVKRCVK